MGKPERAALCFLLLLNGFTSGGQVATALDATGSFGVIGGYLVSYLGVADANTAVTGGATALSLQRSSLQRYCCAKRPVHLLVLRALPQKPSA